MRLLLDANLSPTLVKPLTAAGDETVHVADVGLLTANDEAIFDYAVAEDLVLITADSDFPMMLALRGAGRPSVVLLRHPSPGKHPGGAAAGEPADRGARPKAVAVVSLSPTRLAVRNLPIT